MSKDEIKKVLEEQLQLLAEKSKEADLKDLYPITSCMTSIACSLIDDRYWL